MRKNDKVQTFKEIMNGEKKFDNRVLTSLDEFDVVEKGIAQGGFGVVDKGVIKATGQLVAMKRLRGADQATHKAMVNEFRMMCQYSHPTLQTAVGLYQTKNISETVLITPFCENGALDDVMKKNPPQWNLATKIIIIYGLVAGMKYLHKFNVSHRDLKPQNILIDEKFRPIITDFGISRTFDPETLMSTYAGTILYMAPEMLSNGNYTEKVDVYSFGLIVNEMFTGVRPYNRINNLKAIKEMKYSGQNPDIARNMPDFLKKIVLMCLKVDPSQRPSFKKIYNKILLNYNESLQSIVAEFDKYKQELMINEQLKMSTFNIPKPLVHPIQEKSNNETNPIQFEELDLILSRAGNRRIVLIMVFGPYQSGKSTYLRTLTGNAAFYPGKGTFSQTEGILIDGPYFIDEIINRIPEQSQDIKSMCLHIGQYQEEEDPAIFFIDSQGIGDEKYFQYQSIVLDRINAMFTSVSTICLTISNFADTIDDMKTVLATIRRAQLTSMSITGKSYTKVIFLVRNYEASLNNVLMNTSLDQYEEALPIFGKTWWNEHKLGSEHYAKGSILALPLGDLSNMQVFLNTVWYSFSNILGIIKTSELKNKEDIVPYFNISDTLFYHDYDLFNKFILDADSNTKIPNNVPVSLKHCFSCCNYLSQTIYSILIRRENESEEEALRTISTYMFVVTKVFLPYILGKDDISFLDFAQYSLDIWNDCSSYTESCNKKWKSFTKHFRNYFNGRFFIIGAGVVPYIASVVSSFILPPVGIALSLGTIAYDTATIITQKVIQKSGENILNETITSLYPFIWEKELLSMKPKEYEISTLKKRISNNKDFLIIFYEQPGFDSTVLFQSLTGVKLNVTPANESKGLLFKSLDPKKLFRRFDRYITNIETDLTNKVDVLYLRGASQSHVTLLEQTQSHLTSFVTSISSERKLTICPSNQASLNVFYLSETNFEASIVDKQQFKYEMWRASKDLKKETMTSETYLPILFKNDYVESGPRCHASIKFACRFILHDPKIAITKEDIESFKGV